MILEPVTPFRPREYAVKVADQAWEQRAAAAQGLLLGRVVGD